MLPHFFSRHQSNVVNSVMGRVDELDGQVLLKTSWSLKRACIWLQFFQFFSQQPRQALIAQECPRERPGLPCLRSKCCSRAKAVAPWQSWSISEVTMARLGKHGLDRHLVWLVLLQAFHTLFWAKAWHKPMIVKARPSPRWRLPRCSSNSDRARFEDKRPTRTLVKLRDLP